MAVYLDPLLLLSDDEDASDVDSDASEVRAHEGARQAAIEEAEKRSAVASGEGWAPGLQPLNSAIASPKIMTPYLLRFANRLRARVPLTVAPILIVNSGLRTAEAQARAMVKVLEKGGPEYFTQLYKEAAVELLALPEVDAVLWAPKVADLYRRKLLDPKGHLMGGALDIGVTNLSPDAQRVVEQKAKELGALEVLRETKPTAHLHIQIPTPPASTSNAQVSGMYGNEGQTMTRRALLPSPRLQGEGEGSPHLLLLALVQLLPGPEPMNYGEPPRAFEGLISAERLVDVDVLSNRLMVERAEDATNEFYDFDESWNDTGTFSFNRIAKDSPTDGPWMGRPTRGAPRLAWDAAARFVRALEEAKIDPGSRAKCGRSPGNAIWSDDRTGVSSVDVRKKDEAAALRFVDRALRGGLGKVKATTERTPMGGIRVSFQVAGDAQSGSQAALVSLSEAKDLFSQQFGGRGTEIYTVGLTRRNLSQGCGADSIGVYGTPYALSRLPANFLGWPVVKRVGGPPVAQQRASLGAGGRHRDPRLTEVQKIDAALALAIPDGLSMTERVIALRRRAALSVQRAQLLADLQANPPAERGEIPRPHLDEDDEDDNV